MSVCSWGSRIQSGKTHNSSPLSPSACYQSPTLLLLLLSGSLFACLAAWSIVVGGGEVDLRIGGFWMAGGGPRPCSPAASLVCTIDSQGRGVRRHLLFWKCCARTVIMSLAGWQWNQQRQQHRSQNTFSRVLCAAPNVLLGRGGEFNISFIRSSGNPPQSHL